MTTETEAFVSTMPNSDSSPPSVHWIDDCPTSKLKWWFPLALSSSIYFVNIVYLLVKHLLKRFRPEPTPQSMAYPNIFRGIDQNDCDVDIDPDFDFSEDDPFHRQRNQWLEEMQFGDTDDWTLPSMAATTDVPFEFSNSSHTGKQSENEDRNDLRSLKKTNGEKPGEHFVSLKLESFPTLDADTSTGNSKKKSVKFRPKQSELFGRVHGSLNQRIRFLCEQMTSVSYRSGRILVRF
ncbi:unnamed protein product [Rodentolepis nana]|uniref:RING/U-box superfamily protein n=1 Tax=Rodentolepis nana TaxID=102285 RepID=A0A0R3T6Z3_RODNA|nr:unnamed protein product [Rodentolepis nana]